MTHFQLIFQILDELVIHTPIIYIIHNKGHEFVFEMSSKIHFASTSMWTHLSRDAIGLRDMAKHGRTINVTYIVVIAPTSPLSIT